MRGSPAFRRRKRKQIDLGELVRRVVGLETRLAVRWRKGPIITIAADAAQIEQLLINILHNAVDAVARNRGQSDDRLARTRRLRGSFRAR